MKRKLFIVAIVPMLVFAATGFASFAIFAPRAQAAVASWQKGMIIMPDTTTDFGSAAMAASLKELAATGANYVTLLIPYQQATVNSTDIEPTYDTPSDVALTTAIQEAHADGLHVQLTIYDDSDDTSWRAYINPSDRDTWFANYGAILDHYASLGQSLGVEQICLGGEMIDMTSDAVNSTNTSHWLTMIANVRAVFTGTLTYNANWGVPSDGWSDEKQNIGFWPELDYIGISEYTTLANDQTPSVSEMVSAWQTPGQDIVNFAAQYNKPVLFGEIGYRSVDYTAYQPWDWSDKGNVNQEGQANAYQAFFDYWNQYPQIAGVSFWNWDTDPNAGGASDSNYTPQNKLAETVLTQVYGGSSQTGGGPENNPSTMNWAESVSAPQNSVNTGQQMSIPVTITNKSSDQQNNLIVDTEIYNSANQQVFQQYYPYQNFDANQSPIYNLLWTPTTNGTYIVKLGIFSSDWSQTYAWFNNAATIMVGQNIPPPQNVAIDLWWPTNGATVSGVQPFKAMIPGVDPSTYTMTWQVDGGSPVTMPDNATDSPHKEFDADLSSWAWNGSGPYNLVFIARDLNSNIIATAASNITIAH